jgi:2-oxoglutarate ferredoxin oxidoreductase subunit alpha
MPPVVILSDGYLANSAEPWKVPNPDSIAPIEVEHPVARVNGETFLPYRRDIVSLARPWAVPGTPGLEHRIGGLSKAPETGNVSYDPDDHWKMITDRREKIERLQEIMPPQQVVGPKSGPLLVLSWGSTYGMARAAVERAQATGVKVAHTHLRYLTPAARDGRHPQALRAYPCSRVEHGPVVALRAAGSAWTTSWGCRRSTGGHSPSVRSRARYTRWHRREYK